jgi:glycosyltransferase involved in cell wall biosynthesis
MSEPLVSIIIPNYNRASLIVETLNSVQAQTYKNWEAIIIDDGSTDNSLEVIATFTEDKRFRLLQRERNPKGAPTCRNIGIEHANGEYIVFLDSDDLIAPYCLEQRVAFINSNPQLDFGVFQILIFNKSAGDSKTIWNTLKGENDLERFISLDLPWATPSCIWQKTALITLHGWSENFFNWQDWDLHLRAIVNDLVYKKSGALPDCFVRRNEKVARISSHKPSATQIDSRIRLFTKNYEILKAKGLDAAGCKHAFAAHFLLLAEQIALFKVPLNIEKAYSPIRENKLVDSKTRYFLEKYLKLFQILTMKNVLLLRSGLYKLSRLLLPDDMVQRKSTHLKLQLDEVIFNEVLQKVNGQTTAQ